MSDNKSNPLAVDIATAAQLVGLSRAQFYRLYLNPGLLKSMKTGGRDRIIDYGELLSAYGLMRAALPRADLTEAQTARLMTLKAGAR
jgi:hypothetical protein